MTFKHISFSDSETMRSLVKVASERGMIQADSGIEKMVASMNRSIKSDIDVKPTDDLQVNLLKLCSALRIKGFASYADAVEVRLGAVKVAETHLYRSHDEDGEDVLMFAHEGGGVEMAEATDELGVVEDLIERHKKMLDVTMKEPTGKLEMKASVVESLKIALGQQSQQPVAKVSKDQLSGMLKGEAVRLSNLLSDIKSLMQQPEIAKEGTEINTGMLTVAKMVNMTWLWLIDLFKMSDSVATRKTELNPSAGLLTIADMNSLLTNDPAYHDLQHPLTITGSDPSELNGRLHALNNFYQSKIIAQLDTLQNEEVKQNAKAKIELV